VGLDLGTTTVTGVLLDATSGEALGQIQRRNNSSLRPAVTGRAEQEPQRIRSLALEVLAELVTAGLAESKGRLVSGLALTGQMHGLLCVDAAGQPLTPLISWQDQRTAEPLCGAETALEQIHRRTADLAWQENGCRIWHGYGAATLFWLVQQGQLPRGTVQVCTIADWLAGQLTSQTIVTDPTFAASWGIYSLLEEVWNAAFVDRLELEPRLFPQVRPSGEKLGGLAAGIAQKTGLPGGLPVFNALGDGQASFLGSVTEPEQSLLVNLGTGGQVCWRVLEAQLPTPAVETRPLLPHAYLQVGASLCGGAAYAWLNQTVRAWLAEFGIDSDEDTVYERLNALATDSRTSGGLRVRTTFLGVRGDPAVRAGAIEGITLDNLHLGALTRATLTGIVDELADLYQTQASNASDHRQVIAAGGGVWANPLLPGLLEERFGLPVQVLSLREAAAVGAAMLAAAPAPGDPKG
jgi:sedoheptulokinase